MPHYNIGEIVKKRRKQLGLSQADLAGLTIDVSNLSRLERGIQVPQKEKLDTILERLGLNPNVLYSNLLTTEESDIYQKREELELLLYRKEYSMAEKLISELTSMPAFDKITNRQFIMYAKAVITTGTSSDGDTARKAILDAIKVTLPEFSAKNIKDCILTQREVRLINMLASTYSEAGEIEKAVELLYGLQESLDVTHIDNIEMSDTYSLILYNLTKCLGMLRRYEEAVEMCDHVIKLFIRHNNTRLLPHVILNKACDTYEIGDKETAKRLFLQAYYCCDAYGYYEEKDSIKKQAKDKYGLLIK